MIDLYTAATPNGRKISILLEELGAQYNVHHINLGAGEQKTKEFLKLNPNGRIPVITDCEEDITIFESGAIMLYLARKFEKFLPKDIKGMSNVEQWLMWQMGGLGPMQGQSHVFRHYAPGENAYSRERYFNENLRLYGVMNTHLKNHEYLAGEYSIADIACWPWVDSHDWAGIEIAGFEELHLWYEKIKKRPAVQKGMQIPESKTQSDQEKKNSAKSMLV